MSELKLHRNGLAKLFSKRLSQLLDKYRKSLNTCEFTRQMTKEINVSIGTYKNN